MKNKNLFILPVLALAISLVFANATYAKSTNDCFDCSKIVKSKNCCCKDCKCENCQCDDKCKDNSNCKCCGKFKLIFHHNKCDCCKDCK